MEIVKIKHKIELVAPRMRHEHVLRQRSEDSVSCQKKFKCSSAEVEGHTHSAM